MFVKILNGFYRVYRAMGETDLWKKPEETVSDSLIELIM